MAKLVKVWLHRGISHSPGNVPCSLPDNASLLPAEIVRRTFNFVRHADHGGAETDQVCDRIGLVTHSAASIRS